MWFRIIHLVRKQKKVVFRKFLALLCLIVGIGGFKMYFLKFFTSKSILLWPTQIKNFRGSTPPLPLFFLPPPHFMKLLGKTFKCKMKIMGENQMLTYFFCAVFITLYFKTKRSNETFHLGFYSFSNVFSYRKHISSKINI